MGPDALVPVDLVAELRTDVVTEAIDGVKNVRCLVRGMAIGKIRMPRRILLASRDADNDRAGLAVGRVLQPTVDVALNDAASVPKREQRCVRFLKPKSGRAFRCEVSHRFLSLCLGLK